MIFSKGSRLHNTVLSLTEWTPDQKLSELGIQFLNTQNSRGEIFLLLAKNFITFLFRNWTHMQTVMNTLILAIFAQFCSFVLNNLITYKRCWENSWNIYLSSIVTTTFEKNHPKKFRIIKWSEMAIHFRNTSKSSQCSAF